MYLSYRKSFWINSEVICGLLRGLTCLTEGFWHSEERRRLFLRAELRWIRRRKRKQKAKGFWHSQKVNFFFLISHAYYCGLLLGNEQRKVKSRRRWSRLRLWRHWKGRNKIIRDGRNRKKEKDGKAGRRSFYKFRDIYNYRSIDVNV